LFFGFFAIVGLLLCEFGNLRYSIPENREHVSSGSVAHW
jgi:hypothetical protein